MWKYRGRDDLLGREIPDTALMEVGNRDLWQLELVGQDDYVCGRVIRQLVEPTMYTIRYIIVFDDRTGNHVPVPADAITEITEEAVYCSIDAASFLSLPALNYPLDRTQEEKIHATLARTPYWIAEAHVNSEL